MKKDYRVLTALLLALTLLAACSASNKPAEDDHEHASGESGDHEEAATGPHGGRLLQAGDVAVEVKVVEAGAPPRWQAWVTRDGKSAPTAAESIAITMKRLEGSTQTHRLRASADGRLLGDAVVEEPHSFQVQVTARIDGREQRWAFDQWEGRTRITPAIAREAGIRTAVAGAGEIADEHEVQGLLTPIEGRTARVGARFPGPVRSLHANVGDRVRAGQVLARVESNLSLSTYTVSAPIDGVVLQRQAAVGDVAGEGTVLFEIADLSTLWVDLHVFGADASHIRIGSPVQVTRLGDGVSSATVIDRILPGTATASQSTVARAVIANADGLWRPGTAVRARITVERAQVAIVVPISALQTLAGKEVVFVRVGDTYEARPLQLGKRDAQRVQVLQGLQGGEQVVVEQSYVVKADIEKSGATHAH